MVEARQDSTADYVPLMTLEEREDGWEGPDDTERLRTTSKQRTSPGLSTLTTISMYSALTVSLLAFFLSLLSFSPLGRSRLFSSQVPHKSVDVQTLRRPSLYLGLDRVPEIKLRLEAEALLAETRPTSDHSDTATVHVHGGAHNNGEPSTDGMVLPTAYVRLSRLYPDMNWTDENVVLTNTDSMVLYFPLPDESASNPDRCTFHVSFPSRAELDGRLLTIEGNVPSLTLTLVSLPQTFHGSALSELTWNRKPTSVRGIGSFPVAYGTINRTLESFQCYRERVVLQLDLSCDDGEGDGCRVEFRGSDTSDMFGIALFM